MKHSIFKLTSMLLLLAGFASCNITYTTQPYYVCYPTYDWWGYYMYDNCYWEYWNNGEQVKELDMSAQIADSQAVELEKTADLFAQKFNLSTQSSMKIAKNIKDFAALEDRSEDDIAQFAQKLYGVNPNQVVSAVSMAQLGDNTELDSLIEQAAQSFETDSSTMKEIVKELHGQALQESGINL